MNICNNFEDCECDLGDFIGISPNPSSSCGPLPNPSPDDGIPETINRFELWLVNFGEFLENAINVSRPLLDSPYLYTTPSTSDFIRSIEKLCEQIGICRGLEKDIKVVNMVLAVLQAASNGGAECHEEIYEHVDNQVRRFRQVEIECLKLRAMIQTFCKPPNDGVDDEHVERKKFTMKDFGSEYHTDIDDLKEIDGVASDQLTLRKKRKEVETLMQSPSPPPQQNSHLSESYAAKKRREIYELERLALIRPGENEP